MERETVRSGRNGSAHCLVILRTFCFAARAPGVCCLSHWLVCATDCIRQPARAQKPSRQGSADTATRWRPFKTETCPHACMVVHVALLVPRRAAGSTGRPVFWLSGMTFAGEHDRVTHIRVVDPRASRQCARIETGVPERRPRGLRGPRGRMFCGFCCRTGPRRR